MAKEIKMLKISRKILEEELSLMDMLKLTGGYSENEIREIKEYGDIWNYHFLRMAIKQQAYNYLVKHGKIDGNEIYNLNKRDAAVGDIGFKSDGFYTFNGIEWQKR